MFEAHSVRRGFRQSRPGPSFRHREVIGQLCLADPDHAPPQAVACATELARLDQAVSQRYGNLKTFGHLTHRHVVPPARPATSWTTIRPSKRNVAAIPPSNLRDVLRP